MHRRPHAIAREAIAVVLEGVEALRAQSRHVHAELRDRVHLLRVSVRVRVRVRYRYRVRVGVGAWMVRVRVRVRVGIGLGLGLANPNLHDSMC